LAAPLVGEQLRDFGAISPGPAGSFLVSSKTAAQGFLLASPLRAVLEQVFSGLYAPPAIRVRPTGRLLEILSGEAVASLQLLKTGGRLSRRGNLRVICLGELRAFVHFRSEKLARDRESGKRLFLTMPCP